MFKCNGKDFFTLASVVKRECEKFKRDDLSPDSFKWNIFVQRLISSRDLEIQVRILTRLKQDSKLKFLAVVD